MANDSEYIKQRLQQWAMWVVQREGGGLGFPSQCSYTRMMARSSSSQGFFSPDIDVEAMEIEAAVRRLPEYLMLTVRVFYVAPGTIEQKARDLGVSRRCTYTRIDKAHAAILLDLELKKKKIRRGLDSAAHNL